MHTISMSNNEFQNGKGARSTQFCGIVGRSKLCRAVFQLEELWDCADYIISQWCLGCQFRREAWDTVRYNEA